jgi:hypothetical protein
MTDAAHRLGSTITDLPRETSPSGWMDPRAWETPTTTDLARRTRVAEAITVAEVAEVASPTPAFSRPNENCSRNTRKCGKL